ncbi:MAG: hypothetical protein GOV15_03780, partial [Candidatus Diapherotrites archaeon]|nr:hypothetical protein [Candidatus Diapherotrites archaeon]
MYKYIGFALFGLMLVLNAQIVYALEGIQPVNYSNKVVLTPGVSQSIKLSLKNYDLVPRNVDLTMDLPEDWDFEALNFTLAVAERKEIEFLITPNGENEYSEYVFPLMIEYNDVTTELPFTFVFNESSTAMTLETLMEDKGTYYLISSVVSNISNHKLTDLEIEIDAPLSWRETFSPSKNFNLKEGQT